jgi:TonB family protein
MRPHSPNAYLTSLILHGFVAALIMLSAIYMARSKQVPVIIELVQGPGNDLNALEAPAEGVPEPMKMNVPEVKAPPEPAPAVDQTPAVPEPPVTKTPPTKAEPVKAPPVPKAKSEMSMAKQMKQSQKTSYKEFLKKNPIPKQSAVKQIRAAKAPQVDVKGVLGGAKGGKSTSTKGSGGKVLSREQLDQISTYLSFLAQEAKRVYEGPPGVSDQLSVKINFDVTASGAIMNPRIAKSSGNRDFDAAVLDAFRRANSIGPTPDRRPHNWTITFQMKDDA